MNISLKRNNSIPFILIICYLILLIGCNKNSDLLLITDPYYEQVLLNESILEQFNDSAKQAGRSFDFVTFDSENQTGTFIKEVEKSGASMIMLSPQLSVAYKLKQDEFLIATIDNLRDKGVRLISWVTSVEAEKINSMSLTYGDIFLVLDPLKGWDVVDKLLSELYSDYHKVGVIYNRTAFGYDVTPEELLPILFSDTTNHPELIEIEGASISSAKAKDSITQCEERGVDILCLFSGTDTPEILKKLEDKLMLAIIEQGEYLPTYHKHLYGSLSIDYKEICDQLFSTSFKSSDSVQFIRSTKGFFPY